MPALALSRLPKYRLHKPSGRAVVTLPDGLGRRRTVYLGAFDSPESRAEYNRVIADWLANGRRLTPAVEAHGSAGADPGLTVNEWVLAWDDAAAGRSAPDSRAPGEFR